MIHENPSSGKNFESQNFNGQPGGISAIAGLNVSEAWKARFSLIEKAGGVKLKKFKELKLGERLKVRFNLYALLFGPIYYIVKGMWKKGLTMFVLLAVAVIMLAVLGVGSRSLDGVGAALFCIQANIDFYKKTVLNQNEWW
jgi:hypothetical protein